MSFSLGSIATIAAGGTDGFLQSVEDLASGLITDVTDAIIGRPRVIGTLIPDIVIREIHDDRLRITEHPVENSAPISDHAYKEAQVVEMEIAWSDSTWSMMTARGAYKLLLALQNEREPFFIATGKRVYRDMLIESVRVITDSRSEHALNAVITCRQVLIVTAQTVNYAPESSQANPESTAATQETGPRQPEPKRSSILAQAGGLLGFLGLK